MLMEINLLDSFGELFSSSKRIYWQYIISSLFIALIYLYFYKKERKINLSHKLWLHKSAILDYKYFILSFLIKTILIVPIVISVNEITIFVYEFLTDYYGYIKIRSLSYFQVVILFTITLFVVSDFTRYWIHRFLHTVPFLWEFHKVHHSDMDYDLSTGFRFHPIEIILSMSIKISFVLIVGAPVIAVLIFEVLLSTFAVFHHSNINLSKNFDKILRLFIVTPNIHRIHHSIYHDELNSNYGFSITIWDKLFKTYNEKPKNSYHTMTIGL